MSTFNLSIIAFAAAILTGCAAGGAKDDPPISTSTSAPAAQPLAAPATASPPAPAPVSAASLHALPAASSQVSIEAVGPYIDASAFLNALVESGCQIDKAEYKEVKRGGAIKVVCSRTVDPLSVGVEDL